MKSISVSILAAGAALMALSAPAAAALPTDCQANLGFVTGAISCSGYYSGNIFSSSPSNKTTQSNALTALGFVGQADFTTIYAVGSGYKLDFSGITTDQSISFPAATTLFGTTFVGIHWGGNQSAIYKLDLTSPVSSLTIKGKNPGGLSNAVLFSTSPFTPAVPEPASWALMISGFGLTGAAMRTRATKAKLTLA